MNVTAFIGLIWSCFLFGSAVATIHLNTSSSKYIRVYDDSGTYTWYQADTYCVSEYGTRLGSVHSAQDENEMFSIMYVPAPTGYDTFTWIGLNDLDVESGSVTTVGSSTYSWIDGTDYDWDITWGSGEPNDDTQGQDEDCIWYQNFATANDATCGSTTPRQFICNKNSTTESPTHVPSLQPSTSVPTHVPTLLPTTLLPSTLPSTLTTTNYINNNSFEGMDNNISNSEVEYYMNNSYLSSINENDLNNDNNNNNNNEDDDSMGWIWIVILMIVGLLIVACLAYLFYVYGFKMISKKQREQRMQGSQWIPKKIDNHGSSIAVETNASQHVKSASGSPEPQLQAMNTTNNGYGNNNIGENMGMGEDDHPIELASSYIEENEQDGPIEPLTKEGGGKSVSHEMNNNENNENNEDSDSDDLFAIGANINAVNGATLTKKVAKKTRKLKTPASPSSHNSHGHAHGGHGITGITLTASSTNHSHKQTTRRPPPPPRRLPSK